MAACSSRNELGIQAEAYHDLVKNIFKLAIVFHCPHIILNLKVQIAKGALERINTKPASFL